jgi:hypothetical protein
MQDSSLIPTNEVVDKAVRDYAETIIRYILTLNPEAEYGVDYDEAMNDIETEKAAIIDIQTENGFVTIFPDFAKNTAKAAVLNRGLIRAMEIEGFDDDTINNSPVYGNLMSFSIENAETFGILLTNDLGLQHQKNILE